MAEETGFDVSKATAVYDCEDFGLHTRRKVYEINGRYYYDNGMEIVKDTDDDSWKVDFSNADAVHDNSEFGGVAGYNVYEVDGHYYFDDGEELVQNEDGSWSVLVPWLGVADSITKEEIDESTQKVVDAIESGKYDDLIKKYGNGQTN